jgi:hypothetical protein
MNRTITITLDKAPAMTLPDNYVRPVQIGDAWGLYMGFGKVDPSDTDRIIADPEKRAGAPPYELQPLLFGTIADAEKCAAAYVSWLQQYPDPRADGAQFAFYTQVFPTYPSAALDEAGEP